MIRNYLKVAVRNLKKHRGYTTINILGLALGLASGIFILLWIRDELSYDQFHTHAEHLFRVTCQVEDIQAAISVAPMAAAMKAEFPEVFDAVMITQQETALIEVEGRRYNETEVIFADSNFFANFSFPLLLGHSKSALDQPNSILLTKNQAIKYFGSLDVLGKTIRIDNQHNMVVTGVLQNIPEQSHLQFDILMPVSAIRPFRRDIRDAVWDNFDFYTYVRLDPSLSSSQIKAVDGKMDDLFRKHQDELRVNFRLQPLLKIHLHSDFLGDLKGHGQVEYVYLFGFVAVLILLAAAINFMNLSTARAARRTKEVGFRKVVGAARGQLIFQFLAESCVITFISLMLAIVIVGILLPPFNQVSAKAIALSDINIDFIIGILFLTLLLGIIAGSYPAFYLSGFRPIQALTKNREINSGSGLLRNALVVLQFVVSIILIIGTIVMYQQRNFIQNHNLGFDKQNLVYINLRGDLAEHQDKLRNALERSPVTAAYTITDELPTDILSGTVDVDWAGKDPNSQVLFAEMDCDEHFLDVFEMKLKSGNPFRPRENTDQWRFILNEKAVEIMDRQPEQIVGEPFTLWGTQGIVVGVVENFHFKPITKQIEPMIVRYSQRGSYAVVRAPEGQLTNTINALEQISGELNPIYPFEFGFINEDLENQYLAELRMGKIANVFALLAIFISCLGLYGLSAFLADRKRKEIGIRKVVGASVSSLVVQLNSSFTRPIWLAILIAIPCGYALMQRWLESFAYHVDMQWTTTLTAAGLALIVALLTISIETIRAATAHPMQALKRE